MRIHEYMTFTERRLQENIKKAIVDMLNGQRMKVDDKLGTTLSIATHIDNERATARTAKTQRVILKTQYECLEAKWNQA